MKHLHYAGSEIQRKHLKILYNFGITEVNGVMEITVYKVWKNIKQDNQVIKWSRTVTSMI